MKKISVVFLGLLTVLLITGCGVEEPKEQKLVCTSTQSEEGIDASQVISMTYKNNKLNHMTMEVNTKITDSKVQKNWDEFKKSMDEQNQEFDKDGVTLKVTTDDQNYEYKVALDIDVENASEEVLKEQGFEDLKDDNSTLESSKADAEKDGFNCEVK